MFLKITLILRNLFNHIEFSDPFARLHWERHGSQQIQDLRFKWFLLRYTRITVVTTLTTSILIISYIGRVVEKPFSQIETGWDADLFINNVYLTVITMAIVGFGDFDPYTTLGKLVAIFTAFRGGFIISLLVTSVKGKLQINFNRNFRSLWQWKECI